MEFGLFSGIEWSLRAFASMRALRLFLRARAIIKCVLRAESTLLNNNWRKFPLAAIPFSFHFTRWFF